MAGGNTGQRNNRDSLRPRQPARGHEFPILPLLRQTVGDHPPEGRARMKYPARVPRKYGPYFRHRFVDGDPVVATAVGLRPTLHHRWECRMCGKQIIPNTAAAQSHIAKHARLRSPQQGESR